MVCNSFVELVHRCNNIYCCTGKVDLIYLDITERNALVISILLYSYQ